MLNRIASTTRMTGVNKRTVLRLLADLGCLCAEYQDLVMTGLAGPVLDGRAS